MRLRLALSSLMAGLLLHRSCSLLTRIQVSSSRRCLSGLMDRISSQGVSLDVNLIASQPQLVISHLKSRNADSKILDDINTIISLRADRSKLIMKGDAAKAERNSLSQQIGQLMKNKQMDEVAELKRRVEAASLISAEVDAQLSGIDASIDSLLSVVPNLLDDRVPEGSDDAANVVVREWGAELRKVGEGFLWHDEIGLKLGTLDTEAAIRTSGARFSVLKGSLARLERALIQYFLDFQIGRGYEEVSVPFIVSRSTLEGTGQLPKFEDDLFKISHSVAGEDAFLIPTAEVPVTNLYRDQLLDAKQLPIKHVCHSPSFRAEAGSHGRDTRGLLRQHQFHKVELVKIVTAESSSEEHEAMVGDAEALLESLQLPYRRMLLCSGDIGFSARICYDLEVWLPGQQAYREISSVSNCGDFQARRMSLRYRVVQPPSAPGDKKGAKKTTAFPHTLNGSGVAVGRALVAVLENYQEPDGRVRIPDVLRPYMGGLEYLSS